MTAGDAQAGRDTSIDPAGFIRIGSIPKLFVATFVSQLADEGRVALHDPFQAHAPDLLPPDYPPITVRQLHGHTSGCVRSPSSARRPPPSVPISIRPCGCSPGGDRAGLRFLFRVLSRLYPGCSQARQTRTFPSRSSPPGWAGSTSRKGSTPLLAAASS